MRARQQLVCTYPVPLRPASEVHPELAPGLTKNDLFPVRKRSHVGQGYLVGSGQGGARLDCVGVNRAINSAGEIALAGRLETGAVAISYKSVANLSSILPSMSARCEASWPRVIDFACGL